MAFTRFPCAVVDTWADRNKHLEQYLKRRLAKGPAFVPRPLEPIGMPRVGNGVYDYNGDLIDEDADKGAAEQHHIAQAGADAQEQPPRDHLAYG